MIFLRHRNPFLYINMSKGNIYKLELNKIIYKKGGLRVADVFEMIFYGRGGQGVKTASQMVADSFVKENFFIQSFPEYGPERAGAPVKAFTRISKNPIRIHCPVDEANMVVVIDPTLIGQINVTEKIQKDGILIVNSEKPKDELKKELKYTGKLYCLDANKISQEIFGKKLPNIVMLGAMSKIYPELKLDSVKDEIKTKFQEKLGDLGVKKNFDMLERGFREVL